MSEWIFAIGFVFFAAGLLSRLRRDKERDLELSSLETDVKVTRFWGYDTTSEEKAYREKLAEYRSWKNVLRFEAPHCSFFLAGAVIWAIATLLWISEDPTHTWDQLWDQAPRTAGIMLLGAILLLWVYRLLKRLDRSDREIAWLNQMLRPVKDHAEDMRKASIDNFLELRHRLDRLEGKPLASN